MEILQYIPDWVKNGVIYHIYPLGFLDAPKTNSTDTPTDPRLAHLRDYYEYLRTLGVTIIQFGPIFHSESHGYNTIDYRIIDPRLGTNQLFQEIVNEFHDLGMRVIVDGVFNHVGREFASFKDIQQHREFSSKLSWHFINFRGNSPFNDGFDYQNWEGHYSLVKLNIQNPEVKQYLFEVAHYWLQEVGIDGWRLDVAYLLSKEFLQEFRDICKNAKPDSFLLGEIVHNPYTRWVGPKLLDAGTGYQVYKSIWSAMNARNMYELKAVLEQAFHPQYGVNKDLCLMNFLGNHDTTRIASQLKVKKHLYPAFLLLFTLNGIPKIYYGDEIGIEGKKTSLSDADVRRPMPNMDTLWSEERRQLYAHVQQCIRIRQAHHALRYGNLIPLFADNTVIAFLRQSTQETLLVIVSIAESTRSCTIPLWNLSMKGTRFVEQLSQEGDQEYILQNHQLHIPQLHPYWGRILRLE